MQRGAQRIRNLVLLGVLLAGAIGVASVVMAPWVEESVSDISRTVETPGFVQEPGNAGKQNVEPADPMPMSVGEIIRARLNDRDRWVDVF